MTAQVFERILYEDQKLGMATTPLDAYFVQNDIESDFEMPNTALWRGYIGTWEIRDDRLWLSHLTGHKEGRWDVTLETIFPDATGPVLADWYTGTLKIPRGKELDYVHMGFETLYEEDVLVGVERGVVVSTEVHKNKPPPGKASGLWSRLFGR